MKSLLPGILFLSIVLLTSCRDKNYVNGEIILIDDFERSLQLSGEEIVLDSLYAGTMSVYDSLIILSSAYPDHKLMRVFNLNTCRWCASLYPQGRGPGDFYELSYYNQFVEENGEVKLWVRDVINERFMLLNLSRSIEEQRDCFDYSLQIPWRENWKEPFTVLFMLDTNLMLCRDQNEFLFQEGNDYSLGKFRIYEDNFQNEIQEFDLYRKPLVNPSVGRGNRFLLYSIDRLKPDGSMVVMVMEHLMQINLLDLKTARLKAYRFKHSPDFQDLATKKQQKYFYWDVGVDDKYIYALFSDQEAEEHFLGSDIVHVFDWKGKPVCDIKLDHNFVEFVVGPKNHRLYGKTGLEEIYVYQADALYGSNHENTSNLIGDLSIGPPPLAPDMGILASDAICGEV